MFTSVEVRHDGRHKKALHRFGLAPRAIGLWPKALPMIVLAQAAEYALMMASAILFAWLNLPNYQYASCALQCTVRVGLSVIAGINFACLVLVMRGFEHASRVL